MEQIGERLEKEQHERKAGRGLLEEGWVGAFQSPPPAHTPLICLDSLSLNFENFRVNIGKC